MLRWTVCGTRDKGRSRILRNPRHNAMISVVHQKTLHFAYTMRDQNKAPCLGIAAARNTSGMSRDKLNSTSNEARHGAWSLSGALPQLMNHATLVDSGRWRSVMNKRSLQGYRNTAYHTRRVGYEGAKPSRTSRSALYFTILLLGKAKSQRPSETGVVGAFWANTNTILTLASSGSDTRVFRSMSD